LCAVVPQNIHIFNGTVLENIAYEKAADEEVIHFLHEFGFTPFLDALPQSVFTVVGEEGINLSGGQKQIIALARALYQKPELLILDEATAAMDRESERFVIRLLSTLKTQMAILFITHRIHILKSFADRIYVMEQGSIHSYGSHQDLLNSENLYSLYWKEQEFQEA
jgi:ABC-type multidrug transport system fused ATPase/permease subunit